MKICFEGWRHREHLHRLINGDISDLKPSNPETYWRDNIYLVPEEDRLVITAGVENLRLTGNFRVEISLTKQEIANLASIAFRNERFSKVLAALSKRGCAETVENKK